MSNRKQKKPTTSEDSVPSVTVAPGGSATICDGMRAREAPPLQVHTIRSVIRDVPAHWHKQYDGYGEEGRDYKGGKFADITRALDALDLDTATREDIKRIIGNDSWAELDCDACGESVGVAVEIGHFDDDPDGNRTARLCADCLAAAVRALVGGARAPGVVP